jgi:hypothetical protein
MAKRGKEQAELRVVGSAKPKIRKPRRNEWTKAKERTFFTALSETCNVKLASEAAGMSPASAYWRRKRDAAFRAGWGEAIGAAYQRLELVMLDRALNGTEKIVVRKDGSEERMREYPNHIAMHLLKMHRDSATEAMNEPEEADVEEIRERLLQKLRRLRERIHQEDKSTS